MVGSGVFGGFVVADGVFVIGAVVVSSDAVAGRVDILDGRMSSRARVGILSWRFVRDEDRPRSLLLYSHEKGRSVPSQQHLRQQ